MSGAEDERRLYHAVRPPSAITRRPVAPDMGLADQTCRSVASSA
jgi:hypothetical protein